MIKIIYAIIAIIIKDLKVCLNNSNLLITKNAICFQYLAQKRKIDKQIASILYYNNYEVIL